MPTNRKWPIDCLLNVITPVLLGWACYAVKGGIAIPAFISNHLADGLWAYAFMSCILIIWQRKIAYAWVVIVFLIAIGYEWLQYQQLITGTGDIYDVLTYFLFFIIALQSNYFFFEKFNYQN